MKKAKDTRTPIQHGEIMLVPVPDKGFKSAKSVNACIVGHSETGHHHVVESKTPFEVMGDVEKHDLFVRLFEPAKLVHKKSVEKHKTLPVLPGVWKILHKSEYSPWEKVTRRVQD